MKIFRRKRKINRLYIRTYTLILLPVLLLIGYSVFAVSSYNASYRKLLCTSYKQSLSVVYSRLEDTVQGIINTAKLLPRNDEFMRVLTTNQADSSSVPATALANQFKESNSLIDSVFVVDRIEKTVYGTTGTCDFDKHFNTIYKYENYDATYWRHYQMPFSEYKILPPSRVNNNGVEKTITPIVFNKINGTLLRKMLIVNVNDSYVFNMLAQNTLTENSRFLLINKLTHTSYEKNDKLTINDTFYRKLLNDTSAMFTTTFDQQESLIITFSPSISILGYAYAAVIPVDDINAISHKAFSELLLLGIFVIGITFFLIQFSTRNVYSPIHNLAATIGGKDASSDPIANLQNKITEMQKRNDILTKKVSDVIPLAQEHTLIQFLNSDLQAKFDGDIIMPDFTLPCFCAAIIKLCPTELFYHTFNTMQSRIIYSELSNIIDDYFGKNYVVHIISGDLNTLSVLINTDDKDCIHIENTLHKIKDILSFDSDYIKIYTGLGGIYSDFDSLRKSYQEALRAVSGVMTLEELHIHLDSANLQSNALLFSQHDETLLTNLLLSGKIDEATAIIEKLTRSNMSISEVAVMQLNTRLLSIIFKVMGLKGISYDSDNKGDIAIMQDILSHSPSEIFDTIRKLLDEFAKHIKTTDRVDIRIITEYMQNNFASDLYLDKIAEMFDTSSKYLSRKFKESVGMSFTEYLSGLRLEHAKTLLVNTNKPITDIMPECGFNNRTTFIRAFKNYTGDTPGSWRKNNQR